MENESVYTKRDINVYLAGLNPDRFKEIDNVITSINDLDINDSSAFEYDYLFECPDKYTWLGLLLFTKGIIDKKEDPLWILKEKITPFTKENIMKILQEKPIIKGEIKRKYMNYMVEKKLG